jgi:tRNA threonylcarbamoyladenosine biosynthesis protein TsaB
MQQPSLARVLVVLDARMDQVYSAAYEWDRDHWREVQAVGVHAPEALVHPAHWADEVVCAGNAWSIDASRWPTWVNLTLQALPTAAALCQLAPMLWQQGGGVDPELALPLYVRDKVAQTTAEREQLKAAGGVS